MIPQDNTPEQEKNLEELNYSASEDIFNKEEHVPLDGDGNPITNRSDMNEEMPYGLDIPGFEDDDNFEQINSQIPTNVESLHTDSVIEDDLEDEGENLNSSL